MRATKYDELFVCTKTIAIANSLLLLNNTILRGSDQRSSCFEEFLHVVLAG
jgi:hypothetical protein